MYLSFKINVRVQKMLIQKCIGKCNAYSITISAIEQLQKKSLTVKQKNNMS